MNISGKTDEEIAALERVSDVALNSTDEWYQKFSAANRGRKKSDTVIIIPNITPDIGRLIGSAISVEEVRLLCQAVLDFTSPADDAIGRLFGSMMGASVRDLHTFASVIKPLDS